MLEYLKEWVWNPMANAGNYNPFNTLLYALVFIGAVELYWKLVAKKENQGELRKSALPFIVLAGFVRFANARLFDYSMVMVTPGIFFVIVAAFTFSFKFFGPKRTREIGWALIVLMFLLVLQFLRMSKIFWMIPLSTIVYIIYKLYSRLDFMKDSWAWLPHIFEAWVTSFGVFFGLIEEHVLAGVIMQGNPFTFGIIKTLLIPVIMYLIKDTEKVQKIYIGSVIGALGLGPGIRDLLELLSL